MVDASAMFPIFRWNRYGNSVWFRIGKSNSRSTAGGIIVRPKMALPNRLTDLVVNAGP